MERRAGVCARVNDVLQFISAGTFGPLGLRLVETKASGWEGGQ